MGWSLGRKQGAAAAPYRDGYLRSAAWRETRRRYFAWVHAQGAVPTCQVCAARRNPDGTALDLHHLTYEHCGKDAAGHWYSRETVEDLVLMCRDCHKELHRILDGSGKDWKGWDRRRASVAVIVHLKGRRPVRQP